MTKKKTLASLEAGKQAVIVSIEGGSQAIRRLEILGLKPGKEIEKVSGMFLKGPVTVRTKSGSISLGYGIASKVVVEEKQ
jgi:ferrous iron transport protein A